MKRKSLKPNPSVKIRYINNKLTFVDLFNDSILAECIPHQDREIFHEIYKFGKDFEPSKVSYYLSDRLQFLIATNVLIFTEELIEYSAQEYKVMLLDSVRVSAYLSAIRNNAVHGGLLIEIGSGLGIFGIAAAKMGMDVICIEPGSSIEISRQIAKENDVNVKFFKGTLEQFIDSPPPYWQNGRKADIVVSEFIGDYILEEGIEELSAIAVSNLLKNDGLIIPASISIEVVGIQSNKIQQMRLDQRSKIDDCYNSIGLKSNSVRGFFDRFSQGLHLHDDNYFRMSRTNCDFLEITKYSKIFAADLRRGVSSPRQGSTQLDVVEHGRIDGYVFSFIATLDASNELNNRISNLNIKSWPIIWVPSNLDDRVRPGDTIDLSWAYTLDFGFWHGGFESISVSDGVIRA